MDIIACANRQIRFNLYLQFSGRFILSPIIRLLNERPVYPMFWVDGKKDIHERNLIKAFTLRVRERFNPKFREWCVRNKLKTNDPIAIKLFETTDSGKIDFNFEEVV